MKVNDNITVYISTDSNCICFLDGIISANKWKWDSSAALYYCTVETKDGTEINDFVIHKDDIECVRTVKNLDRHKLNDIMNSGKFHYQVDEFIREHCKAYMED